MASADSLGRLMVGNVLLSARRLARAALRTACTMSLAASSRKLFSPTLGLVMMDTAPDAIASKVAWAPCSASDEQITVGVGCSAMIFFRKVMPSMRGISMSMTSTSGQWCFIFCSANIGSAATSMTSMPGSLARACETTWRTSAESSTIMTLILSVMGIPDLCIRSLREGQPHVAAPDIEMQFPAPAAADVFGHQGNMAGGQQAAAMCHVARADIHRLARRSSEHVGAAEQFGLVFARPGSGRLDMLQEQFESLAAESSVQRRLGGAFAFGEHVVAHAA